MVSRLLGILSLAVVLHVNYILVFFSDFVVFFYSSESTAPKNSSCVKAPKGTAPKGTATSSDRSLNSTRDNISIN